MPTDGLNGLVEWLIRYWDPATTMYPPFTPPTPPDGVYPWTVELHYMKDKNVGTEVCRSAVIVLNAGVSGREAQRIAAVAQKALDPSIKKTGRPRLSDMDREILRSYFERLGFPNAGQRAAMARKVQKQCIDSRNRKFSVSVIGDELRRWLDENGQPVRRYTT